MIPGNIKVWLQFYFTLWHDHCSVGTTALCWLVVKDTWSVGLYLDVCKLTFSKTLCASDNHQTEQFDVPSIKVTVAWNSPVSAHIWYPTGGHMGKIMGPLWATQRGPTWGMIMGFHWDPSGISLGIHMGPRSFPSKFHTNSHMGPNWVCPCISHIYIYIYVLFINLFCWCCFCLLFDHAYPDLVDGQSYS